MKLSSKIAGLKNIKSILFVRLGKLGDMMAASYAVKSVKQAYPGVKTGLLTLPRSRELFRYCGDIDTLILWKPLALPFMAIAERLRKWDLLVDLTDEPSRRSVLALKLIGPEHSIAFRNEKTAAIFENTIPTPDREKTHMLERMSAMACALGGKKIQLRPVVYPAPGMREKILAEQEKAAGKKSRVIAFNISAGHASRYWQEEKWVKLAQALLKKYKHVRLKILHSPADKALADGLAAKISSPRLLIYSGKNLHEFLAHIQACSMLVSPDTSAVHAACAFGVPVAGLYPEPYWNFISWKPYGRNTVALRSKKEGVGNIGYDEVRNAVMKMAGKIL